MVTIKSRPPLDPARGFLAPKNMRFNGKAYLKGEALATDGVPDRKLAQLYQSRVIDQPGDEQEATEDALSDADQARADRLESDYTRKQLDQLAKTAGVDAPASFGNKAQLAAAIVRRDPEAGNAPDLPEGDEIGEGSVVVVDDEQSPHHGKRGTLASLGDGTTATIKLDENPEAIETIPLGSVKLARLVEAEDDEGAAD